MTVYSVANQKFGFERPRTTPKRCNFCLEVFKTKNPLEAKSLHWQQTSNPRLAISSKLVIQTESGRMTTLSNTNRQEKKTGSGTSGRVA